MRLRNYRIVFLPLSLVLCGFWQELASMVLKSAVLLGALFVSNFDLVEKGLKIDVIQLVKLVQDSIKTTDSSCKPKYDLTNRQEIVAEFLTIKTSEIDSEARQIENEVLIFLKRPKHMRPGLLLTVELVEEKCETFTIHEIMH